MSIDGPGIVESDLAHDVYNDILDFYDSGLEPIAIRERIAGIEGELVDELDLELYLAATVKAFWEIGNSQEDFRSRLQEILVSGRTASRWAAAGDSAIVKEREKVLARLLKQTSLPRRRPRPRKKYRSVTRKLFGIGDCLVLDVSGEIHRSVVVKILEYRGRCEYAVLVMERNIESTTEAIAKARYFGRKIPTTLNSRGFDFGPHVIRLDHRMLIREGNCFLVVGKLSLDEKQYCLGSFGGCMNLGDVISDYNRTEENARAWGQELLPLADLLKKS